VSTDKYNAFRHYEQMTPSEDCVALFGIRILAFYGPEGTLSFKVITDQEVQIPLSTHIGIMEMAKHEMLLMNTINGIKEKEEDEE